MPDERRMKKIEAFFRNELARIVSRELHDPVFENKIISFPEIRVSKDLSVADISVSVLGNGALVTEIVTALNAAEPFIRSEIMQVSELRKVPKFKFHEDHQMETASKIDRILDMLDIPPAVEDEESK
jgi:ribosome-binding factor A